MREKYTNWFIGEIKAGREPMHNGWSVVVKRMPGCIFRVENGDDFAESNDLETALWFILDPFNNKEVA